MRVAGLISALALPSASLVDQRIPKKLLIENAATARGDKRRITEGVDEVRWVAALKPSTIGVAAYRSNEREYLEIAVLSVSFRDTVNTARLIELIHRAIPYPVVLVSETPDGIPISLVHKRRSEGEAGAVVLDGDITEASLGGNPSIDGSFLGALPLSDQPRANLHALYQGWIDAVTAHRAARITGRFSLPASREHSSARQVALRSLMELDAEMARVRREAERETQLARQVERNLELNRLRAAHDAAHRQL
jgi:hypothetical protein